MPSEVCSLVGVKVVWWQGVRESYFLRWCFGKTASA
jgi:hypothetical protein